MFPKLTAFTSIKLLQWINWLGAGSVAIFGTLEGSGIHPARAIASEAQVTPLGLNQAEKTKTLGEFQLQESEASFHPEMQVLEQLDANFLQQRATTESLPSTGVAETAPHSQVQSGTLTDSTTRSPVWKVRSQESGVRSQEERLSLFAVCAAHEESCASINNEAEPRYLVPRLSLGTRVGRLSLPIIENGAKSQVQLTIAETKSNSNQDGERSTAATQSSSRVTDTFPLFAETLKVSPHRTNTTLAQRPSIPQPPSLLPVPSTSIPVSSKRSTPSVRQIPALPQPPNPASDGFPASPNLYNPTVGQLPALPQSQLPVPGMGVPLLPNPYNSGMGQFPYYPQAVLLVPVPANGMPPSPNLYNPGLGQSSYYPQVILLVPVPATGMPLSPNPYNLGAGQSPYYPQNVPPLPPPLNASPAGFHHYNPNLGQFPYYPQSMPPQAIAPIMIPVGTTSYNPALGQFPYYPQNVSPPNVPFNPSPVGLNPYNPYFGQSPYPQPVPLNPSAGVRNSYGGYNPYFPQGIPSQPVPLNQNAAGTASYNSTLGQSPYFQQPAPSLPSVPYPYLTPPPPSPTTGLGATPPTPQPTLNRSTALTAPSVRLQGAYVTQGDESAARARLSALYPVNPRVQLGGSIELITGENVFSDSRGEGLNLNELYVAVAPFENLPNFRLVAGQMDLTSYFDRNSFAKDGVTHFFNPVFQTNPALSATGIASRSGALVNWMVTDNIEAKAAIFSSARDVGDFSLDGFAGEIGIRYGNAIIRGTYASDRDAGSQTSFREIFGLQRSDTGTGIRSSDREQAYGVNVEYFIPQLNMGLFGRYGRYDNRTLGRGGDTYSAGITFLDVFTSDDRLGLAYGRDLSNDVLRRQRGDEVPDVLELFYDFRFLPNFRLGFTIQQRNGFTDTFAGFRVKTEFDITPAERLVP